jgi:hypothetical protein
MSSQWFNYEAVTVTAIFAYVNGPYALIAAHIKRADPMGLFPAQIVQKVHCWANCIPFACTGNGANMDKLASAMLNAQSNYSPDETGLVAAFHSVRPGLYATATNGSTVASKVPSLAKGTLLVAVPEHQGEAAHIFELDFATGARNNLFLDLAAQGTNPAAFLTIALMAFDRHTAVRPFAGDIWAATCIDFAVKTCSRHVGWPFDVVITRPNGSGGFMNHQQQFTTAPTAGHPTFAIP